MSASKFFENFTHFSNLSSAISHDAMDCMLMDPDPTIQRLSAIILSWKFRIWVDSSEQNPERLFLFIDAVCDCPALSSAIMKYSTNAIIR
jgi:hypothetical protein